MKCNTCTHLNSPVKDCYNNDKRKCKSYDKKCCGNCTGFENEDSLGNGYCSILYIVSSCWKICSNHKLKNK